MYGNNKISARQIKRLIIVEVLAVSSLISTDIAAKYSGTEVKIDGEEYTIVRQSDILAVVE